MIKMFIYLIMMISGATIGVVIGKLPTPWNVTLILGWLINVICIYLLIKPISPQKKPPINKQQGSKNV